MAEMAKYVVENIDHISAVACFGELGFHVTAHSIHGYLVFHKRFIRPRILVFFTKSNPTTH